MSTSAELIAELKTLHPALIDLSLGRVERLLAKLGSPHETLPPVVHVAGTNGKGSTIAFLKAIFEAADLRVHIYTSPHLVRFHERIMLATPQGAAAPIADATLIDVLTRVRNVNDGDEITQFESITAAAFLAFAEHAADVVLLEVGLGGRLDATNVIARPALGVITPVSMDHAEMLGETLAQIAGEKAGILKPNMTAVVSKQEHEALESIASAARNKGARLKVLGSDFDAYEQRRRLVYQSEKRVLDLALPGMVGNHQITNAGTAVAAALEMKDFAVSEAAIDRGLQNTFVSARMQRLRNGPLPDLMPSEAELWLDGGHNPAAGNALARTLADLEERSPKPAFLITGMMTRKDASGFFAPFAGLIRHVVTLPVPGPSGPDEKAFPPHVLASIAQDAGLEASARDSVKAALAYFERTEPGPKRILICGSLYLAGHVLAQQEGVLPQPD